MTDPLTMLEDIPNLAAEVEATHGAPNPGLRPGRHARPTPGPKPPTNLASLHALTPAAQNGLRAELVTSVRLIVDEMANDPGLATDTIPDWPDDTWPDLCQWLTDTAWWWQHQSWASEVEGRPRSQHHPATGLRKVWGELRDLARVPREVRLPCLDEPGCQGTISPDPDTGAWPDHCTNGHLVDRHMLAERARQQIPVELAQILAEVKRPEGTIKHWISQGWLRPVRYRKPRLYMLGDAMALNAKLKPGRRAG